MWYAGHRRCKRIHAEGSGLRIHLPHDHQWVYSTTLNNVYRYRFIIRSTAIVAVAILGTLAGPIQPLRQWPMPNGKSHILKTSNLYLFFLLFSLTFRYMASEQYMLSTKSYPYTHAGSSQRPQTPFSLRPAYLPNKRPNVFQGNEGICPAAPTLHRIMPCAYAAISCNRQS